MLTKEQILSKMRGFDCPKYLTESCWQPIYDQCVAAIDLAAENERLKAKLAEYAETFSEQNKALSDHIIKLDAVSAECNKHIPANKIERLCLLDEYDIGQADLADNVLAIIDKDGDDK